jgi:hypothetical protein
MNWNGVASTCILFSVSPNIKPVEISTGNWLWLARPYLVKTSLVLTDKQAMDLKSSGKRATLIMCRIHPLLGKDLGTNNETTAVTMQRFGKHASTTIELLLETVLCKPLLDSCNSWTTTMGTGMFSVWSVPRSNLEDNWGDPVSWELSSAQEAVKIEPERWKLKNLHC